MASLFGWPSASFHSSELYTGFVLGTKSSKTSINAVRIPFPFPQRPRVNVALKLLRFARTTRGDGARLPYRPMRSFRSSTGPCARGKPGSTGDRCRTVLPIDLPAVRPVTHTRSCAAGVVPPSAMDKRTLPSEGV